jgi:hypothetical protein
MYIQIVCAGSQRACSSHGINGALIKAIAGVGTIYIDAIQIYCGEIIAEQVHLHIDDGLLTEAECIPEYIRHSIIVGAI